MPIYTYRCDDCGIQFDRHQSFKDQPLKRCPECGKRSLHKVYAPVGIVFKGSGFYATDNRSPSGQTSQNQKIDEAKPKKSESSVDSKPEDKKSGDSSDKTT